MKRTRALMLILAIFAFSDSMIHTATQSVEAINYNDKEPSKGKPVTVTITGKDGVLISKSTFKKDTTGFVGKLRFDWEKGEQTKDKNYTNTITAYYNDDPSSTYNDDPSSTFSLVVSKKETPRGSQIRIQDHTITIGAPFDRKSVKKMEKESEAVDVKVMIHVPGDWDIVTGSEQLTQTIAANYLRTIVAERYVSNSKKPPMV